MQGDEGADGGERAAATGSEMIKSPRAPLGVSTKSLEDIDRLYRTANSLFKTNGYKPAQSATAESQDEDVRTIIGLALNRKQIGPGYHTDAYPYFMRSQGPFKVYDHAQ